MKNLIEKIKEIYEEKSYLKLFMYSIVISLIMFFIVVFTYYICMMIFYFIAERFEVILVIVGGYIMIYLWWKDKQKNREEKNIKLLNEAVLAQESAEKVLCESNYTTIRQCLFSTLSENAEILNLRRPEKLSELDAPSKTINKGNVYMCQFVAVKKGEINSEKIKEILQLRIIQKLNTFEFSGITQTTFIYNGNAYPILMIDEVYDNGTFVQIDIAWASENYCNLLNARAHAKMHQMQPRNVNFHDKDF